MRSFAFTRAKSLAKAIESGAQSKTAQQGADVRFIAGGTTLLDLMKLNVEVPSRIVDINRIGFDQIEKDQDGKLRIGAMVRNADLAHHPLVRAEYTALSEAILSGASAQLRNMATTGGNLLQRTRCVYFRTHAMACNKREPGSGCSAIDGENRTMAVLGGSLHCVATHPSDMAVALVALEASIHIQGIRGGRTIPIQEFYLVPGTTPHIENIMQPGDVITYVTIPSLPVKSLSAYLKLRDRASYEFALASAAVVAVVENEQIRHIRIALGGLATKPWRAHEAEATLVGKRLNEAIIRSATDATMADARPLSHNGFKLKLARRCIAEAIHMVMEQVG